MKKIRYKEGDILPITIITLSICLQNYICNAYKLAIDKLCPDLKGKVATDTFDNSTIEFLEAIQEKWCVIMTYSMGTINRTLQSLANINGLDLQAVINDERIENLAIDIYLEVIQDWLYLDTNEHEYDGDLFNDMVLFTFSIIGLVHCLFDLNKNRVHDPNIDYLYIRYGLKYPDPSHPGHQHWITLDLLNKLWTQMRMDFANVAGEISKNNILLRF